MLLTGTFHRSLDDKLRFAIPRSFRDAVGLSDNATLYVTPGTDGSLELYSEEAFSQLAAQLELGPGNTREVRAFSRLFFSQVQRVELDKLGRVRLTTELVRLAALGKEIVLVGVRDHMELWDLGRWEAYVQSVQPHYDELVERATSGFGATKLSPMAIGKSMCETMDAEQRPSQPR